MNGHQKTLWVSEGKAIFLFEDMTLNSSIFVDLLLARPDLSGPKHSTKRKDLGLSGHLWREGLAKKSRRYSAGYCSGTAEKETG